MFLTVGILSKMLAGGYVVFGVFQVYSDLCFIDSLSLAFRMIGSVPFPELLVTPQSELPQNIRNNDRLL